MTFETSCVMRSAACEMDAVAPRALNSCQSCGGVSGCGHNRMPPSCTFARGVILKKTYLNTVGDVGETDRAKRLAALPRVCEGPVTVE